jgi:hypothetical protein
MEASSQLPDAQILFRPDFHADVTFMRSIRVGHRLVQNADESSRRCGRILDGSQAPRMEIA